MASNYPGSLDSFDTIASDKKTSDAVGGRTHRQMHNDLGDAIEAVQSELGTNPSGSDATVAARLTAIEAGTNLATGAVTAAKIADDTITAAQIAANAVGASELADNAVDTNAIADGAATPAKLATTGRFVFPTGAANGYGFTSGAVHLSGTGTPEGVVTAAPGSTWLQTDATTDVKGWIRWIKATGTGNTGWRAGPEADTGWRDVSSLLVNSWTGTNVLLRRVGDAVSFRATLNGTTASAVTALNLPVGFRPKSLFQVPVPRAATLSDSIVAEFVATDGAVVLWSGNGKGASQYVVGEFMTPANQSWPSSLPGSAA